MPRTLAAGELWKKLTQMRVIREASGTHGDTTTTAAITGAGNETTVGVTGITNFTAADTVLVIGDGGVEALVIGTPNVTMPLTPPPKIPQSTGATFVEAELIDLGKLSQNSVQWTANRALTAVFEEIGDAPLVYIPGNVEFSIAFALFGYNGPNVQFVTGYAESETGDGAAYATAYQAAAGLPGQALQADMVFRVQGLRHDAKNLEVDFCRAYVEATVSSQLGREQPATLNGTVKSSAIIIRQWT